MTAYGLKNGFYSVFYFLILHLHGFRLRRRRNRDFHGHRCNAKPITIEFLYNIMT